MKPIERYLVTAKMSCGHVADSELYLDAILSAVHPAMHGIQKLVRGSRSLPTCAPLPFASIRHDNGHRLLFYCSSADYVDGVEIVQSNFVKRRDATDAMMAARSFQPGSGPMRDRMEQRVLLMAPTIQWSVASNDPKEIERLLRRVSHLGGLRKMGYGEVRKWSIDRVDSDIDRCLSEYGKAVRRLPISVLASYESAAVETLAVMPPYWYAGELCPAVTVGTTCTLREDLRASA